MTINEKSNSADIWIDRFASPRDDNATLPAPAAPEFGNRFANLRSQDDLDREGRDWRYGPGWFIFATLPFGLALWGLAGYGLYRLIGG